MAIVPMELDEKSTRSLASLAIYARISISPSDRSGVTREGRTCFFYRFLRTYYCYLKKHVYQPNAGRVRSHGGERNEAEEETQWRSERRIDTEGSVM